MQKASALLKPDEDEDPNSSASFSNQLSPPTTVSYHSIVSIQIMASLVSSINFNFVMQ